MELIGKAKEYYDAEGVLRLIFHCTNKEELDLRVSGAVKRIPINTIVRAWTERPLDEQGIPRKENVLVHWEDL